MSKEIKVVAVDEASGVSPEAENFAITSVGEAGKAFRIGAVQKKIGGWVWFAFNRHSTKKFPSFEAAAKSAARALGAKIQFEEVLS